MRPKTSVFHVALHADVRTLTKAHAAEGKTSTRRETRPSLAEDNSKTSNTTLWCSWYRWTRFFIAQSMSMMSCQVDHGARCCCHGKFIRTGMRIFVWKTVEGLIAVFYTTFSFQFVSLGALHNPERSLNSCVLSTPASSNVLMTRRRLYYSSL